MTVYAAPGNWPDARCLHPSAPPMEIGDLHPGPERDHQIARRRTICHACPHLDPCRQWALTSPDPAGAAIAGGMTPQERDKARRGR